MGSATLDRDLVRVRGDLAEGAYLTDGTRLFRVVDAALGDVVLEDCYRPDDPPAPWSISELMAARMRFVRK